MMLRVSVLGKGCRNVTCNETGPVHYRVVVPPNASHWMYSYTTGGVLQNRAHLERVGFHVETGLEVEVYNDGEFNYKQRVYNHSLTMASIVLPGQPTSFQYSFVHRGSGQRAPRT
eukprot:TRINITY_DN5017_c0_g1_i2.p1 TRINITY_DN5017_c0_g1~~TRINITY_DN5017_c0_g1_i2.p1  ORF type:complete len:115 (-),score=23.18 TRINITY_DN5017_c0_g1_i2:140-484(-)